MKRSHNWSAESLTKNHTDRYDDTCWSNRLGSNFRHPLFGLQSKNLVPALLPGPVTFTSDYLFHHPAT